MSRRSEPPSALQVLAALLSQLDSVGAALRKHFRGVTPPQRTVQWKKHTPVLARTAADMIELEPRLFAWLPFSAETLRALERELFHLTQIKSFLASLDELVDGILWARRDELTHKTGELLRGLQGLLASPATPAQDRERLEKIGRAVFAIIEEHNAAVLSKREEGRALRGAIRTLSAENSRLRAELSSHEKTPPGTGSQPGGPPPAPRTGRRRRPR